MPITEAGFHDKDGKPDHRLLIDYGPTVKVFIGHFEVDGADTPEKDVTAFALIDSGATESCIDIKLAEELELPAVDERLMAGVNGTSEHKVYLAHIHIPDLNFTQHGRFTGVHLSAGGQEHKALLGRTFLKDTIMIYDGFRGNVSICTNTYMSNQSLP